MDQLASSFIGPVNNLTVPLGPSVDLHEVQNAKLPPERRRQYWRQYRGRCLRSRGRCAQTLLQDGRKEERKSGERKRKKEIPRARQSMCMWFTRKELGSVCSFPKTNYIHGCLQAGLPRWMTIFLDLSAGLRIYHIF